MVAARPHGIGREVNLAVDAGESSFGPSPSASQGCRITVERWCELGDGVMAEAGDCDERGFSSGEDVVFDRVFEPVVGIVAGRRRGGFVDEDVQRDEVGCRPVDVSVEALLRVVHEVGGDTGGPPVEREGADVLPCVGEHEVRGVVAPGAANRLVPASERLEAGQDCLEQRSAGEVVSGDGVDA